MKMSRFARWVSASGCLIASVAAGSVLLRAQNPASPAVPMLVERKEAAFTGTAGDVVLMKITIAADGTVTAADPVLPADPRATARFPRFARAATDAVKAWRFAPTGGHAVTTFVGINFQRLPHMSGGRPVWEMVAESVPVGGKVKPPKKIEDAIPVYPDGAPPVRDERRVLVDMTVDAGGIPVDAVPLEAMSDLTGPALDAALHWRFEPDATVARKRVKVSVPFVVAASFGLPRDQWSATIPEFIESNGRIQMQPNFVAPKQVNVVRPRYSAEAMREHQQGSVVMEALLDADGTVQAARVTRSLPLLDREALECVRQWKFTPMLDNGHPTPTVITLDLNFKLR